MGVRSIGRIHFEYIRAGHVHSDGARQQRPSNAPTYRGLGRTCFGGSAEDWHLAPSRVFITPSWKNLVTTIATSPLVVTINESERHHREEFWTYVLAEAEPWHRGHLTRLFQVWEETNASHFGGQLVPPIILLAEPTNPRRLGDCSPTSGWGARSQIRIRPSLLVGTHPIVRSEAPAEGRFRFVADVLIHETIHQWQQEVSGRNDEGYHGHGPAFRDQANQIGARLGLPRVRTCKIRGSDRELPSCSYWPHGVRDPAHYLGAYVPVPTSGDEPDADDDQRLRALAEKVSRRLSPWELKELIHLLTAELHERDGWSRGTKAAR